MVRLRPYTKSLGLGLVGALLSSMTVVMGTAPLLALRASAGRGIYLISVLLVGALVSVALPPEYWVAFGAAAVLSAVFIECEQAGAKLFLSGLVSILATSGTLGLFAVAYARMNGVSPASAIKARISELVEQVHKVQPGITIDAQTIIQQIPSGLIMTMVFALWLGLLWAPVYQKMFRAGQAYDRKKLGLREFRLPDSCIWLALVGIIGSFVELKAPIIQVVGTNILNVMALLYFFQGLAVVAFYMRHYKASPMWQILIYFVLFGQLFMLVSLFGLADYWVDFRRRLTRRPAERTGEV